MNILAFLHGDEGHLQLRLAPPLGLNGFRRDDHIIVDMVVIDPGHSKLHGLQVGIPQKDGISPVDSQIFRHTRGNHSLVPARQRNGVVPLVQVQEIPQVTVSGNQVNLLRLVIVLHLNTALMIEHEIVGFVLSGLLEFIALFFRESIPEIDGNIIPGHMLKLIACHIGNGVPEAETGQQKRCTAADSHQHHGQPLPVTENIANGHLIQEADLFPEGHIFQQDLLAGGRGLGTDQLRRFLLQSPAAAIPGDQQHNGSIYQHHSQRQRPVDCQNHIRLYIQHDAIRAPDDPWKHGAARKNSQTAAQNRAAAGIEQVFAHDLPVGIAQRLQRADLRALFIDHPGHGGDADQRRDEQEEHRKHPGNSRNNIGVAVQVAVTHIAVPVQDDDLRLVHGIDFIPGILQLLSGILQLCLRLRQLPGRIQLGLFVVLPALGDLIPALAPFSPIHHEGVIGSVQLMLLLLQLGQIILHLLQRRLQLLLKAQQSTQRRCNRRVYFI